MDLKLQKIVSSPIRAYQDQHKGSKAKAISPRQAFQLKVIDLPSKEKLIERPYSLLSKEVPKKINATHVKVNLKHKETFSKQRSRPLSLYQHREDL